MAGLPDVRCPARRLVDLPVPDQGAPRGRGPDGRLRRADLLGRKSARSGFGVLELVVDRRARGGQEPDFVRLAGDPRIRKRDPLGLAGPEDAPALTEIDEGVVDDDLCETRRLLRLVHDDEIDFSGTERRVVDPHLTTPARGPIPRPREGQCRGAPRNGERQTERQRELPHSTTSNRPIQPRAANSLLCAWNMYLPV